ncbi:MAG TPA: hypothetical protein VF808_11465 [Ktedonobacterales bacterium]
MGQQETKQASRPLFDGHALVAFACAWLGGLWLAGAGPFEQLTPMVWLMLAAAGLALAVICALIRRRIGLNPAWRRGLRVALAFAALALWVGLGAARAAASDPARDPLTVARFARGATVQVQGEIIAEPVEVAGYRIVTVRVSSARPQASQIKRQLETSRRKSMDQATGSRQPTATVSHSPAN